MNAQEIIKNSGDFKAIQELFKNGKPAFDCEQTKSINQYKVEKHDIFDKTLRPDKTVYKNVIDEKGNATLDASGSPAVIRSSVSVSRVAIAYQELIVERRVGFMLSDPVTTTAIYSSDKPTDKEKQLEGLVERIQNDNKMDYKNKEIARRKMSEMECAEIWYFIDNGPESKPRMSLKLKILSPDLGDNLYPLFDNTGDMIAFAREYKIVDGSKEIEHFDVYTADFEYKYINKENTWQLDPDVQSLTMEGLKKINPIPNPVKKIMVIYHSQKKPEWFKVQAAIDREETVVSNHSDMNDYFGSPILAITGKVEGNPQKGDSGKMLLLDEQAKAAFLALNSPPESIKMEVENLEKIIYSLSQTPDISFSKLTSIGNISGIALRLMFLDAHIAVKNQEETFGIGLQRRLNLLKAAIGTVIDTSLSNEAKTLQLKPNITPYLPANDTELIENLSVSKTAGIISTETAIEKNPLVEDPEAEMARLQADKTSEMTGLQ